MSLSEQDLVTLFVKLGVVASLASILVRSSGFKRMLLRETRTLHQRFQIALWFSVVFGAGVAIRAISPQYKAVDLSLEGCLLAGILGGYVTGLLSGVLVSIPAMFNLEFLSMPLLAGLGVMGGVIRDSASDTEDIWSFSPFFDLNLYRLLRRNTARRRAVFHFFFLLAILFAEFLRQAINHFGGQLVFSITPGDSSAATIAAIYATTLFAVVLPLKIWNNTRNESKLEEQRRSLIEARLDALTSQINPHFLFNTLNSVSSLIRTDPHQARAVIYKLSSILRRLLRRQDNFCALREELHFIEDYLSIEVVRFGEKLRFVKQIDAEALDMQLPSMLLQPLIENSIKHGLSGKVEGGTITLRATRSEHGLRLSVEDDGVGIPEARLANLEPGIGVSNVNERLKVLFADSYQMRIDSRPGEGTRIEIDLPELGAAQGQGAAPALTA
ncbi:MAG: sensor histidine kinase [Bryobacteraceae bacterium]